MACFLTPLSLSLLLNLSVLWTLREDGFFSLVWSAGFVVVMSLLTGAMYQRSKTNPDPEARACQRRMSAGMGLAVFAGILLLMPFLVLFPMAR